MPKDYRTRPRRCHAESGELNDGIDQMTAESGGMITVSIIDNATGAELAAEAFERGNQHARAMLNAIAGIAKSVMEAPRHEPARCLCCDTPVTRIIPATVFALVTPDVAHPKRCVGAVYCNGCATNRPTLRARSVKALQRVWPDLRSAEPTHQAPEVLQ
jgi:hypothetical protein